MTYEIKISRGAVKQLASLPRSDYIAIKLKILSLSNDPRPDGVKKLKGRSGYRIRQGKYRIIYNIHDKTLTVIVLRVQHRKDVYL